MGHDITEKQGEGGRRENVSGRRGSASVKGSKKYRWGGGGSKGGARKRLRASGGERERGYFSMRMKNISTCPIAKKYVSAERI